MIRTHVTCTRRLTFEAGHRVYGHESKCANLHGHSYKAIITACGPIDNVGRVIDFSVLKQRIGGWIDQNWDHAFLVTMEDREAIEALQRIPGQRVFVLPYNPTAENIALFLLDDVCSRLLEDTAVLVTNVVIEETENCKAEASTAMVHPDPSERKYDHASRSD